MPRSRPPLSLKPQDVCVALQLALNPDTTIRELAHDVGLSQGNVHNAKKRLEAARLVLPSGPVNTHGLIEFIISGVPYAFPGRLGPEARGVPTAYSGPVLSSHLDSGDQVVWPSVEGSGRGLTLTPLCDSAPLLADRNPTLYALLTVVDTLRLGRARERQLARDYLREILTGQPRE